MAPLTETLPQRAFLSGPLQRALTARKEEILHMFKPFAVFAVLASLAFGLVACSGGGDDSGAAEAAE